MIETDVCVVGGGLAGLTAALRAAQSGLRVTVLERAPEPDYLCNSRLTGGAFHVCLRDIQSDAAELEQAILRVTDGAAHPGLARAVATDARRAVKWLQGQGIRFIKGGAEPHHNFVLSPPSLQRVGSDWRGRGGDVLLRTLGDALARQGGRLLRGHRALELKMEAGRCVGLAGQRAEGGAFGVRAAAVVIADGGFQCDAELVRANISPAPEKVLQRNAGSGLGDGLRMARAAGARLSNLIGFYGHLQNRNALTDSRLWPLPWMDNVATSAIVVDAQARRFADEGRGGVYLANRVAALADPLTAAVIFDQPLWDGPGKSRFLPPNPNMEQCGGLIVRADSVEQLAGRLGLPAPALAATVDAYNRAVEQGAFDALVPPRSTHAYKPLPIRTAPFYGVPVCAGITYTMGGIAIDEWSRAMTADGRPFPGLYAAGGASGGLEGGDSIGYVGGLAKAATTGLRAGEHIAQAAQRAPA
ncbi:FAD-binding protein [Pigmentiphaga soli]|uniref:FAD-binding protein n=1 Tax=Pigmentiphaga soli TaxID=1007095 RepID=A0ABP8H1E5_9BURK